MFKEIDQNDYELLKKWADLIQNPVMALDDDDLLKEEEAAEILRIEPGTLSVWRCTKRYPLKYTKIGRFVRYRRGDLRLFVASRVVG